MISITTKDGTQVSGEVRDLLILLENNGKTVSDYLQPTQQKKDIHWGLIFTPVAIYIVLNLAYIIFQSSIPVQLSKTTTSVFLFVGFILSATVAYFIHHKHKSSTLSLCCLIFLVLIIGANVGYITYSDLTQKAAQKLDNLTK